MFSKPLLPLLVAGTALARTIPAQEYIYGLVVFHRHGDRTWKGLPPITSAPATILTTLGQQQVFRSGNLYREIYINDGNGGKTIVGIDPVRWHAGAVWAEAPDQGLLATTGAVFLQALYPPTNESFHVSSSLANGTTIQAPMNGYQYSTLHTIPSNDSLAIWLKGDDYCPNRDKAVDDFLSSPPPELTALEKSTGEFYKKFVSLFVGVLPEKEVSFKNAYAVFDYINVGYIHNSTIKDAVSEVDLYQLRTLADVAEFAITGRKQANGPGAAPATESSDVKAISGRTLARKILNQMESTITTAGKKNKFSLLVGSYDTFLSFFNLAFLSQASPDFAGIPDYASSMAFELFATVGEGYPAEKDLNVRFMFRNGSKEDNGLTEFALFGRSEAVMSYASFKQRMSEIAIKDTQEWCEVCGSKQAFCAKKEGVEMSNTVAGAIGAAVTIGVIGVVTVAAWMLLGLTVARKSKTVLPAAKGQDACSEKSSVA